MNPPIQTLLLLKTAGSVRDGPSRFHTIAEVKRRQAEEAAELAAESYDESKNRLMRLEGEVLRGRSCLHKFEKAARKRKTLTMKSGAKKKIKPEYPAHRQIAFTAYNRLRAAEEKARIAHTPLTFAKVRAMRGYKAARKHYLKQRLCMWARSVLQIEGQWKAKMDDLCKSFASW